MLDDFLSPYQLRILAGVRRSAREQGARVIGFAGGPLPRGGPERVLFDGSFVFDLARAPSLDGLLVVSTILGSDAGLDAVRRLCEASQLPVVSMGRLPGYPSVDVDSDDGLSTAIAHLVEAHGRQRIGFIRGASGNAHSVARERVFREVLAQRGLPVDDRLVLPGDFLETSGARAVTILFDDRGVLPAELDALVAANDHMAAGAISELQLRGLNVPDDVAVIGFDDEDLARHASPSITTVAQAVEQVASRATRMLLGLLQGEEVNHFESVRTRLVVRESCGCLQRSQRKAVLPERPPESHAATLLQSRRERCLELLEEFGADSLANEGIDATLAYMASSADAPEPADTLSPLENAIRRAYELGLDPLRWREILAPLEDGADALGAIEAKVARLRFKDVCLRISDIAARLQAFERRRTMLRSDAVRTLGSALASARSPSSFRSALETGLPRLGVQLCYLCLFNEDSSTTESVVRYLPRGDMRREDRLLIQREKDLWRLLPGSLPPDQSPSSTIPSRWPRTRLFPQQMPASVFELGLAVYPLVFAGERFGYVVFDEPQQAGDAWVQEGIARELSSALHTLEKVRQLRRATREAETANATKSEFVATMSHELRTPLTAIVGHIDLCLQGELAEDSRRRLQLAEAASRSLLRLVNDLLDFSKTEAARLEPERVEFRFDDVLEHVVGACAMAASTKGLEFIVSVDPWLPASAVGDPLRIGQVLVNLVGNAVKFTFHGEIVLGLRHRPGAQAGESTVEFSVSDTGIGLSPSDRERLFDPFSQGDSSTTRRFGGTGLGLAISQRLVRLMGGELEVESEEAHGSRFSFALPFTGCQGALGSADEGEGARILLLEGNASQRDAIAGLLAAFGYEVVSKERIDARSPAPGPLPHVPGYQFALLDATLHDGTLADATTLLSQPELDGCGPVVVMLPGHVDPLSYDQSQHGGAAAVNKPLLPRAVLEFARDACKIPSLTRQLDANPANAQPLAGLRLLLVQDNEVSLELFRETLEAAGARVLVARDGAEAVRATAANDVDGVLLDLGLPVMDGFAAARAIRMQPHRAAVPIVALTARPDRRARQQCFAAGMNDCLVTPIHPGRLVQTVATWLAHPRQPFSAGVMRTQSTSLQAVPAVVALDAQRGLNHAAGDQALYSRMLRRFRSSQAAAGQELERTFQSGDCQAALRIVHGISSAAGHVGALHLQLLSQSLEHLLRTDQAVASELIRAFVQSVSSTHEAIDEFLGSSAVTSHPRPSEPADLQHSLAELDDLLLEHDTAAVQALARLQPRLETLSSREQVERLEHCVGGYDFPSARVHLRELRQALETRRC